MDSPDAWRTLILGKMMYPPMGGTYLRNWQNINLLSQLGAVAVFSIHGRDIQVPAIANLEHWQHCNLAAETGLCVQMEKIGQWFQHVGLTYYCPYHRRIAQALEQTLATFKPDLVILEQLWMIPYLSLLQKYPCRIVYDAHNVEVPLYEATKCAGQDGRSHLRRLLHIPQIRAAEKRLLQQTDQIWVCSETDRNQLQQRYKVNCDIQVIPNSLDVNTYGRSRFQPPSISTDFATELEQSEHNILFAGNFAHIPNAEAAHHLISKIYPSLKARYPQCNLLLVGRNPTTTMLAAAQADPKIIVTGEVADVRPWLGIARTMVVPLQDGSGTRLKILEAFAAKCPVVSTAKGAEGLIAATGTHLLIENSDQDIIAGVIRLWNDLALETTLRESAYHLVRVEYSWVAVRGRIQTAIEKLGFLTYGERKTDY